jgi:hypothetical protein
VSKSLKVLLLALVVASVYSKSFDGKKMANGEIYRHAGVSCATRLYPLGTQLVVSYVGQTISCEVTDKTSRKYRNRSEHRLAVRD